MFVQAIEIDSATTVQIRGAGKQSSREHRYGVQFPERGWQAGRVTISERIAAGRRERRVLARVSRAAWRLDQARAGTDVGAGTGVKREAREVHGSYAMSSSPASVR